MVWILIFIYDISEDSIFTLTIYLLNSIHTLSSIVLSILLTGKFFLKNEIRYRCTQSMTINQSTFLLFSEKRMATSILGLMLHGHQILQKCDLMFARTKQYMIDMWGIQYLYLFKQLYQSNIYSSVINYVFNWIAFWQFR